jgi:predicted nucleotide-binding protein (sugar kinase/HSP70/actin superfamily)
VERKGGQHLRDALEYTAQQFGALQIDRSTPRPVIGLVGEIYLRFNTYTNLNIIRRIEAAGGEVLLAGMMEWLDYTNWDYLRVTWGMGQYVEWFKTVLADVYQRHQQKVLSKPVVHLLRHGEETPIAKMIDHIRPFYEPELREECVLSMGKAIDMVQHGISGVINVMPFSCMPGIITASMAPYVRERLDSVPWLDVAFDAQGGTNITTRLEAFVYQAREYQRRHQVHA